MKDRLDFDLNHLHVEVRGTAVRLLNRDTCKVIAGGTWDRGGYVRYPRSVGMPLHPSILDRIDAELRQRMTIPGEMLRAEGPRRSAVGYQE